MFSRICFVFDCIYAFGNDQMNLLVEYKILEIQFIHKSNTRTYITPIAVVFIFPWCFKSPQFHMSAFSSLYNILFLFILFFYFFLSSIWNWSNVAGSVFSGATLTTVMVNVSISLSEWKINTSVNWPLWQVGTYKIII